MSTKQAAIEMARRSGRSVILTENGELAVAERRAGAMVGWRTDTGTLLPVDHPRQLSAQPSGAVLHADGRLDRRQRVPHISTGRRGPFLP